MGGMPRSLTIEPISGTLGAEISGVDLAKDLDDATVAAIRQAWLEHLVVFFRDQDLPPARFLAFARCFGQPIEYPFVKGLDEFPEIIPVLKLANERINFGGIWHSDTAYLDVPPMASMLVAREVPAAGGDTLFANMYLAYEALSDGMKRLLAPLRAINSSASADVSRTREDRIKDSARADARKEYTASHPIVRVHPETGRKALYVNTAHTVGIEGLSGGGERTDPRLPLPPPDPARVHLPLPLAARLTGLLGQPLRAAQRDQRLSGPPPATASHHAGRR